MSEQRWPERVVAILNRETGDFVGIFGKVGDYIDSDKYEVREYVSTESVQAVAERLRERARECEQDSAYGDEFVNGQADAFTEAADQLTSLCNRGSNDG